MRVVKHPSARFRLSAETVDGRDHLDEHTVRVLIDIEEVCEQLALRDRRARHHALLFHLSLVEDVVAAFALALVVVGFLVA